MLKVRPPDCSPVPRKCHTLSLFAGVWVCVCVCVCARTATVLCRRNAVVYVVRMASRKWWTEQVEEGLIHHASQFCGGEDLKISPPGAACAVVTVAASADGKAESTIKYGCAGLRQCTNESNSCNLGDKWHLGSEGKAMTAMLCAVLVEKGLLSWDTCIRDCSSVVTKNTNTKFLDVTLQQLLSHAGGFCAGKGPLWKMAWSEHNLAARGR